jgi:hypothetical protein
MSYVIFDPTLPITYCEPGLARGCFDIATRGTGIKVTCWPDKTKQLPPLPWNYVRGVPLWQQELHILTLQMAPKIAARLHWERLWRALEKIPEDQAIAPEEVCKEDIWEEEVPKQDADFKSAFCNHDECGRCKQEDCGCVCHKQVLTGS